MEHIGHICTLYDLQQQLAKITSYQGTSTDVLNSCQGNFNEVLLNLQPYHCLNEDTPLNNQKQDFHGGYFLKINWDKTIYVTEEISPVLI